VSAEDGSPVAVVERKSLADLAGSRNTGTLGFELARLADMTRAAVVVEDRYSTLLRHPYAPAGFLPDMLARVQVRYPEIPIVFLETRPLAEEWTFRYLGAALAEYESTRGTESPVHAAEEPPEYAASPGRSRRRRRAGE
jgi:hypothetical protein